MTPKEFLDHHPQLPPAQRLQALVQVLRGPEGCPWDQRQTAASIIDFVIDEAHELKEALSRGNSAEITSELGDLAFTFTFLCQTLQDQAPQDLAVESVVSKMIVRHPHVFEPGTAIGEAEIKRKWESLKMGEAPASRRLDRDLAASLPAWKKATKILGRARNAGFRYPTAEAAWEKVAEEWSELQEALEGEDHQRREAELGDLLLALLTASAESGLDSEKALLVAGRTLADRLERVEQLAGQGLSEIPYQELAGWYARARGENSGSTAYFLYCGVSPWPAQVSRAISRAARTVARKGLPGALQLLEERAALRQKIADLVNSEADRVAFVPNVSTAALAVGYCLDWQPGDTILLGRHEFPANTVPWRRAAETFGLQVVDFDDDLVRRDPEAGWFALSDLLESVQPRLLALSAVSYWSGFRWPIQRLAGLCQASGTWLYLDAIQALGTVPVDMAGADFLAGGSHKGLLGAEGAGFLAFSPRARQHWVPRLASWQSLPDPVDFLLLGDQSRDPNVKRPREHDPSTVEGGSQNMLGYAGLSAALDYLRGHGIGRIHQHVQGLHDFLEPGLTSLGFQSLRAADPDCRSAILSFEPPKDVELPRLQTLLSQAGIEISIPKGKLRFGCHLPNTEADVRRALDLLPELVRLARRRS
jgi:MazG family protein